MIFARGVNCLFGVFGESGELIITVLRMEGRVKLRGINCEIYRWNIFRNKKLMFTTRMSGKLSIFLELIN